MSVVVEPALARSEALAHGDLSPAVRALDEHLFHPRDWFVIGAANNRLGGRSTPSLEASLSLVKAGRAAAVVGSPRVGVGVVDVDVDELHRGRWVAAEVEAWLADRGCWTLVRPSGGREGRAHVFFARRDYRWAPATERVGLVAEIAGMLTGLAREIGERPVNIALRDKVRPLSSPHRSGRPAPPRTDPVAALAGLRLVLPDPPADTPLRRRPRTALRAYGQTRPTDPPGRHAMSSPSPTGLSRVVPLVPLPRPRRPLLPEWARYLRTGSPPAGDPGRTVRAGGDRSLTEAGFTLELVWAGHTAETAWALINTAETGAMTKALSHGVSWWISYVWNSAVRDATAFNSSPRATRLDEVPDPEVLQALSLAHDRLRELMWRIPKGERPALLRVAYAVLDRVQRANTRRVPVPQRNLALDAGIRDRATIARVLRLLGTHIGRLHTDCFASQTSQQRSTTSYEFEIHAPSVESTKIHPPVSHPPPGAPTHRLPPVPGLLHVLPPASAGLTQACRDQPGQTAAELAVNAGLTETADSTPTVAQLRRTRSCLDVLTHAGLVEQGPDDTWYPAANECTPELHQRAAEAYTHHRAAITAERHAYRATTSTTWATGRAQAAKTALERQKAWWDGRSSHEQATRRAQFRSEFDDMPITNQAVRKATLARRRATAGIIENEHHHAWHRSLTPDQHLQRSLDRRHRFTTLSPGERTLAIDSWQRHRQRFGITPVQPVPGHT